MPPLVALLAALLCGLGPIEHAASFSAVRGEAAVRTHRAIPIATHLHAKANADEDVVTLIHSHHLLDHKPDNLILSGKKYKLRGVACLGRPGVALCLGPAKNVKQFLGKLKSAMPQKKFGTVDIDIDGNDDAAETLDENVEGFREASLKELRELLITVDAEDEFLNIVGVPQNGASSSNAVSADEGDVGTNAGKKKKGKRKK